MKYIVMETFTSYCVVVDEAGRFIKAANQNYEVGETIGRIEPMRTGRFGRARRRVLAAVAGLAACFAAVLSVNLYNSAFSPFALVYMSINPAVRMDVSKTGRVLAVEAENEDGITLLNGYDAGHKKLSAVSDELIDRAIAQGFLADGGKISFDVDTADDGWFQDTETVLRQNFDAHLIEKIDAEVEIKRYTAEAEDKPESKNEPKPKDEPESKDEPELESKPELVSKSEQARPAIAPPPISMPPSLPDAPLREDSSPENDDDSGNSEEDENDDETGDEDSEGGEENEENEENDDENDN